MSGRLRNFVCTVTVYKFSPRGLSCVAVSSAWRKVNQERSEGHEITDQVWTNFLSWTTRYLKKVQIWVDSVNFVSEHELRDLQFPAFPCRLAESRPAVRGYALSLSSRVFRSRRFLRLFKFFR
jgi:hypothetical protein